MFSFRSVAVLALSLLLPQLISCTAANLKDDDEGPVGVVDLVVKSSHGYVLANEETETMVSITASAAAGDTGSHRERNISVVIDRSGSMTGDMMEDAKRAVLELLNELDSDDRISIIAFGTDIDIVLEQTRWGQVNGVEVIAAIEGLEARGTTNMSGALNTGINSVLSGSDTETINRVLLLSDGEANSPQALLASAQQAQSYGIPITTMGLGPWYNEEALASVADLTGGHYRFIESSDSISEFFIAEMNALDQVVTRWATLQVTLGPDVELLHAFGLPATVNGHQVNFNLGELSAGEFREVGLKLKTKAGSKGAHVELVDVKVIWNDALSPGEPQWDASSYIGLQATDDKKAVTTSLDPVVIEKVERQHAYWQVEQAIQQIKAGFVKEGNAMLRQGADRYRANKSTVPVASPESSYDFMVDEAAGALEEYDESDRDQLIELKQLDSTTRSVQGM